MRCVADGKHQDPGKLPALAGLPRALFLIPWRLLGNLAQLQLFKPGTTPPFTGIVSGLTYTVRTTGFLSLYNGLGVTLVGTIPKAGIRFGGNAYCKRLLADERGKLSMARQFLAGVVRSRMGRGGRICGAFSSATSALFLPASLSCRCRRCQGAGTIEAVVAVTPMETMKTKMIESNLGLVAGVRAILAQVR